MEVVTGIADRPSPPAPNGPERRLKVLLLEDVPADAVLVERELRKADIPFLARRVDTREDFLRSLTDFAPDIILADYSLPQFSALDALRLLRERQSDVPVILVTGSHSEEVAVECMREGADDYILKASLRRLPSALQNALRKKAAEREKALTEAAFRRSEEQYRLITDNTRDLICLLDPELKFLYASPSYRSVLGYEPPELTGRSCLDLIHPEDVKALRETLDEARFFLASRHAELRFRHTSGAWQVFESAANFILDAAGKPQRALLVSRDMTDRKRAEREIRKLAAFPRFNPNPVLEFTADGTLTYFNDAALEMARSLKKSHPQAILPLTTATIVRMCLSTGQSRQHVDNSVGGRTLSWSFFPIVGNQVVHCYAEDVTDRLNLEAQLRQAQKMDSVGQLAAGVAHDFNNILTIIQGHAGLLLGEARLSGEASESARQISLAAERAANLTRQLLMFSRKQIMQPQLLDLNEVINNVSKMLRSLLGEQITLRRHTAAELPPIHADPGMLEQIIVNLAVNARDAMPKGGQLVVSTEAVEVDMAYVQHHTEARPGSFVCLSVADTGVGMDAATLSRIFEPFFTTKEVGKGTGLGLATVYGIVKQHQGWIEVASEVGKGTTFRILLPVSTKAPLRADAKRRRDVPGGNETILLVEDEPALRELVQEILEKKGYTVLAAGTGAQAFKLWQEQHARINLLLTDMMMPEGLSGRELAEKLLAERPGLKVVYTSGYSLDVVSPGFVFQRGQTFLQKPYHPETLAQTVRECLDA
jgi:PAS domain S-box-containing protein